MPICNWMFWTTSQMCYSNPLSQIACEIALFIHYSYSPILTSHSLFLSVAHCGGHFSYLNDFSNSSLHAVKLSVKSYSGKLFGIYVKFIFEISWKWKHHLQWDIQLLNILCTVFYLFLLITRENVSYAVHAATLPLWCFRFSIFLYWIWLADTSTSKWVQCLVNFWFVEQMFNKRINCLHKRYLLYLFSPMARQSLALRLSIAPQWRHNTGFLSALFLQSDAICQLW